MVASKTKGQISIEALIIVGVLVIGGVIFASVFLSNISNQTNKANELSGITDDFMNDLEGWNTGTGTGTNPNNPTPTCGDYTCQAAIGENCNSCLIDCGGCLGDGCDMPSDCGLNNCPPCEVDDELVSRLVLFPNTSTPINTAFSVISLIVNDTSKTDAMVKEITIKKDNVLTDKCSFSGQNYSSHYENLEIPYNSKNELNLSFSCREPGVYSITIKSGIKESALEIDNDEKTIDKTITPAAIPVCGDGTCNGTETCSSCSGDCGLCPINPTFYIVIENPAENSNYFIQNDIQLSAIEVNPNAAGIVSCEWFMDDINLMNDLTDLGNNGCSGKLNVQGLDFSNEFGRHDVMVSAKKILTDGTELRKTYFTFINLYDNSAIFLAIDGLNQIVQKPFDLMAVSSNESSLSSVNSTSIDFGANLANCSITATKSVISEIIEGGSTVYIKKFNTVCNNPRYSPTTQNLESVSAELSNSNEINFSVGYDLSLNLLSCDKGVSTYGTLNACVLSNTGANYNLDYYQNNYGLLKVSVNTAEGSIINNYGELKIYIE